MHVLFVHQNFPAQFQRIAPQLVNDYGWQCSFVTERKEGQLPGVQKIIYEARGHASPANHLCTRNFENTVGHAHGVYEAMKNRPEIQPDLIVAHTGFGSSLFLPYLYDAPIINFLELFYQPLGQDLGYRPELPVSEVSLLRVGTKNAMILLDLNNCDRGWTPTRYQREYFPAEFQNKIEVIFDGIDTEIYHRKPNPERRIGEDKFLDPKCRVVTYVARGFEMMRGFDIFIKAAKLISEQYPNVMFVVVGTDRVHYGGDLNFIKAKSFREHVLEKEKIDLSKFHFTGRVPPNTLADILSISDLHIYLTEPFIASWSMVDAMACGAVLLASDQKCVREYVTDGQNGLLCDFFDYEALAIQAVEVLKDPAAYRPLAEAAQRTVHEKYSLDVAMPRLKEFFERVASKRRSPSVRMAVLTRPGTIKPETAEEDPDMPESVEVSPALGGVSPGSSPVIAVEEPLEATGGEIASADLLEPALEALKKLTSVPREIDGWILAAQAFRGPGGEFARLGPRQHPNDLARLLRRVSEWKVDLVADVGMREPGTTFLWTRVARDRAKIICAAWPGETFSPEKVQFLQAMARGNQVIECIQGAKNLEELARRIGRACWKKLDFVFMNGLRPGDQVRRNLELYLKRVRPGGLIAWDGVQPMVALDEKNNGGDSLWTKVKPLYPHRAEYLSGRNGAVGGIAMVKR